MIADMPLTDLSALIQARKLSPVELVHAYLDRIDRFDGALNGFVLVLRDACLAEAKAAEGDIMRGASRGPLHGIPIAHKDIYRTAGVRTTCCSAILKDNVPSWDATVVRQWRDAGTIMLGKLNTHEFAYGTRNTSSFFGPARNPWDLARHTGGSSGGSANTVLMGLCAGATGSDSGGSIRMPSAATGVSGIKPTFGVGSRHGIYPLMWTMDHPGPMGRSARDLALLLQPIAGHDPNDPSTVMRDYPDFSAGIDAGVRGMRIGMPRRYFFDEADAEVDAIVTAAIATLGDLGATIVEVDVPHIEHAGTASGLLHLAEAAAYHDDDFTTRPELFTPETRDCRKIGGRNIVGLDPIGSEAGARRCPTRNSPRLRHAPRRSAPDNVTTPNLAAVPYVTGPSRDWGSGCDRHRWVWIVGWLEFLPEAGPERAIIDGAPNLQQQVGPASRPAHLL